MRSHDLYRRLLQVLPRGFRERHGAELEAMFRERMTEATSVGARVGVWIRTIRDLVGGSFSQHRRARGPGPDEKHGVTRSRGRFEDLWLDVRYGVRGLVKNPLFSTVAVFTVALGVGFNTSIFSLANEILLRPVPIPDSDRLVDIVADVPGGNSFVGFSYPDFLEYRAGNRTLSALAATSGVTLREEAWGRGVRGAAVSGDYFDVVGRRPTVGTPFTGEDADRPGGTDVIVVSDAYWREALGGRRDVLGSRVDLQGVDFEIVGVMPPGFRGRFIGFPLDVWIPLRTLERIQPGLDLDSREDRRFELVGRLSGTNGVAAAAEDLGRIAGDLRLSFPETNRGAGVRLYPFTGVDHSLRSAVAAFLALLSGLALMVLVITCLNLGSMLLSRASTRAREMGIRTALGATATRIRRQLLTETVVLLATAAAAALVVAWSVNALLRRAVAASPAPLGMELPLDGRVVAFSVGVTMVVGLIAAVAPGLKASKSGISSVLGGRSGGASRTSARFRSTMVVIQVAASVVLLATAGALLQSFRRGRAMDTGLDAERIAVTTVGLTDAMGAGGRRANLEGLRESLADVSGIASMAFADRAPVGVARSPVMVEIPGREPPPDQEGFVFDRTVASWDFVDVAGLRLLRGRAFEPLDDRDTPSTVLINRAAWDTWWPGQDPTGQTLLMDRRPYRIVGIVENTRAVVQDATPAPHVYRTIGDEVPPRLTVITRLEGSLDDRLQREVHAGMTSVLPDAAWAPMRTLDDALGLAVLPHRAASIAAGSLGGLGLALAALGLYGLVSFAVGQRRREFGIRLSLGERPGGLFLLVLRGGMGLLGLGVAVGAAGTVALFPVIRGLLTGVAFQDLLGAAWFLPAVAFAGMVAAGIPALRALGTDPVGELRT